MPELPEVETIRRQLEKEVVGRRVLGVTVRFGGRITPRAEAFAAAIKGATITAMRRRAKLLVMDFSNGNSIVTHLKMTGRYLLVAAGAAPTKHTHVVFALSARKGADGRGDSHGGGPTDLHFEDTRKFGYLRVYRTGDLPEKVFAAYGPEPMERSFTAARFAECIRSRPRKKIKPLLLEQDCIAGIGNIYADEGLWRAKIRPQRVAGTLSSAELLALYDGVIGALRQSLRLRGTSADNYVDLYGTKGKNANRLNVYGRGGEPCPRCGTPITKITFGGRGTHYCAKCQK